ncbi:hypothetical protein [Saccharothrix yanglingensis]|uniref:Uncharacterized protein n=1 Tax=Saccharothrix yanglingensis TaxID=659496 RepID=A0ABU0WT57_9PSEU|nr:hypothetical protein [Saccharothrix yanglingensis]MDQ2583033.1 hypothetical protein [Saccharothrix yanglingensis]
MVRDGGHRARCDTAGLRPWALEQLRARSLPDGFYQAFLATPDEDGEIDTYHADHAEDVVRLYESEYVPAG